VRVVGIDLGTRRIGVAVSDPSGTLASPYEVVERRPDDAATHAELARLVEEAGAELVVVGVPVSMDGTERSAALAARAEIEALRARLAVPVETVDERLSTVSAHRALQAAGVRSRGRRTTVDKAAAAVFLQAWLDARPRSGASPTGDSPTGASPTGGPATGDFPTGDPEDDET
jgi:putative holliday junction resolvase